MEATKCLSEEEFDRWTGLRGLSRSRREHIEGCKGCRAVAEQLAAFDPGVAVRRIFRPPFGEGVSVSRHRLTVGSMVIGMAALVLVIVMKDNSLRDREYALAFSERSASSAWTALADREDAVVTIRAEITKELDSLNVANSERLRRLLDRLAGSEEIPPGAAVITVDYNDKPVATIAGARFDLAKADDKHAALAQLRQTIYNGKKVKVYLPRNTTDRSMRTAFETLSAEAPGHQTVSCVAMLAVGARGGEMGTTGALERSGQEAESQRIEQ